MVSSSNKIYEKTNVFGNEQQIIDYPMRLRKVLKLVKSLPTEPRTILDIGCGDGYVTHKLKEIYPNAKVVGVDISENAISSARIKYPTIHFEIADAEKSLPFPAGSFEVVFSGEHIEHVKDSDTCIREIYRVMRTGGELIITTPNLAFWGSRILLLFGILPFACEPSLEIKFPFFRVHGKDYPSVKNVQPVGHLRIFTLGSLQMLLEAYGFKVIKVEGATIFKKVVFKQLDNMLSIWPSLAFGLVLKAKKQA